MIKDLPLPEPNGAHFGEFFAYLIKIDEDMTEVETQEREITDKKYFLSNV